MRLSALNVLRRRLSICDLEILGEREAVGAFQLDVALVHRAVGCYDVERESKHEDGSIVNILRLDHLTVARDDMGGILDGDREGSVLLHVASVEPVHVWSLHGLTLEWRRW